MDANDQPFPSILSTKKELSTDSITINIGNYCWELQFNIAPHEANENDYCISVSAIQKKRYSYCDEQILFVQSENKETKEVYQEVFPLNKDGDRHVYPMTQVINGKDWEVDEPVENFMKRYTLRAWVVLKPSYYVGNTFECGGDLTDMGRAHDVILVVGVKKFFLQKAYLARWSRYFDRMFHGNFEEGEKTEIELNEINAEHFHDLLRYIHPCGSGIIENQSKNHARNFIVLADRFDMPAVTLRCEEILVQEVKKQREPSIDLLELAAKYNLHNLEVACLESLHISASLAPNFFELFRSRIKKLPSRIIINMI